MGMSIASFEPSDTITFDRMDTKCETTLTIFNKSPTNLAYKFKTSNPSCYIVKPHSGILEPNSTQIVTISSQNTSMLMPRKRDVFQVHYNTTDTPSTTNVNTMAE